MPSINLRDVSVLLFLALILSCQSASKGDVLPTNPPAEGFNVQSSDEKAIAIADEVMEAMGGRPAWDATERLRWNFFGRRILDWNKAKNTVEVHLLADSTIIELDMNDISGKAVVKGEPITDADTLANYLNQAKDIWINDSYWLVMPYKLKDSGVTLKYIGKDTTATGAVGDKLSLTFEGVGKTPQNKYDVIVSDESRLVEEWRFYTNATDSIPRFVTPWGDYKKYGEILLSGDRGKRALTDIAVGDTKIEK